ncbi:hypothetical protein HDU96_002444 [Phlyctochytrium bullatum]|nr:hypothetical protein HDU96_002444 [Phlyctochytrium bullatum]
MHFIKSILAVAAAAVAIGVSSVNSACTGTMKERREWRELSSSQQSAYINAVRTLISRSSNGVNTNSPQTMSFSDFVQLHAQAAYYVHATAQFYPFHRTMMWAWEQAINSAGYSDGVPYWDWSVDSQSFQNALIFGANAFGTSGTQENPCLPDGVQGTGQFSALSIPDYTRFDCSGTDCCLRRVRMDGSATNPPELISATLDEVQSYFDFRNKSENNWHSNVHFVVGGNFNEVVVGDMAHGAYSPNDAVFYFHHGMIDKIWWRWQRACPSRRILDYSGNSHPNEVTNDSGLDDALWGFSQFRVRDVMDTTDLCYTYSNFQDTPLAAVPGCPDSTGTTATATTTTTSSTSAAATAAPLERTWFQDVIRRMVDSTVQFQPPSFLVRRADAAYVEDDSPVANASVPTLPPTTAAALSSTAYTLPPTRTAGQSTTAAAEPVATPKCGFFTDEVYAPKEVQVGQYVVPIPDGMKVLYADNFVVKVVPMDFTVNRTDGTSNLGRDVRPVAIYPKREIQYYTPTNPKCTPPPTPHPTMLSYPTLPSKKYYEMMGMDWQGALQAQQLAMKWIDECNCDEKCLSKAARVYHDYPDNPPEVKTWREAHNITLPTSTKKKCAARKTAKPVPTY